LYRPLFFCDVIVFMSGSFCCGFAPESRPVKVLYLLLNNIIIAFFVFFLCSIVLGYICNKIKLPFARRFNWLSLITIVWCEFFYVNR